MVGQDRQLYHRWQVKEDRLSDPTSWNDTWKSLGGDWSHMPVVAMKYDYTLEMFILGNFGQLYEMHQVQPGDEGNGWSHGWSSFADRPVGGGPLVATNADGRLEVFIFGGLGTHSGHLYHRWQTYLPAGIWNDTWDDLGGPWGSLPVVAQSGLRLEVLIITEDRQLFHTWQAQPNDGWKGWQSLGGDWPSMSVVATNDENRRLEVFMVGQDRQLYHRWQLKDPIPDDAEVWNDTWKSLGGDWPSMPVIVMGRDNKDGTYGRLYVLMVGHDRQLYYRWQMPGTRDGWNDTWISLGGDWPENPVVSTYRGRLIIFMVGHDRQLYYRLQDDTGVINKWISLGGDWPENPVLYASSNDLHVFMVGQDRQLYYMTWEGQTWHSLGGDWPSIR